MLQLEWTQPPNDYPSSDGKPMGENDPHRKRMFECIETLEHHFRDRPDVYVTGNLLWFYLQHYRQKHISPDCMVVFGVPKGERDNYLQWEEGQVPQVVFELASKSTRRNDRGSKFELYDRLGVEEVYLFDPRKRFANPRFQAFHRVRGGGLIPVLGESVQSPRLSLELTVIDGRLRFRDPSTGQLLITPLERADAESQRADSASQRAEAQSQRAEAESQRAEAASQRAEDESRRADAESQRAEDESRRAEDESRRADAQAKRASDAERRCEELAARLRALGL